MPHTPLTRYYTIVGTAGLPLIIGPCVTEAEIMEAATQAEPGSTPATLEAALQTLNEREKVFEIFPETAMLSFVGRAANLGLGEEAAFIAKQRIFEPE